MNKKSLREELKKLRQEILPQRRKQAADKLLALLPFLATHNTVLTFSGFYHEIDTSLLNRFLASTGRLLLPKVVDENLNIYRVTNLDKHLKPNAFGLLEPIPEKCEEFSKEKIEVILVPALGFDQTNHRIGYGGGYYDRFLSTVPHCSTIGIGFKEQLVKTLPVESTDFPLKAISLF